MRCIFRLFDENKKELKKLAINKLPYKRSKIVEKSTEKFFDSDPCIIHETYCINYLAFELEAVLQEKYKGQDKVSFNITDCPSEISNLVSFEDTVRFIKIE